MSRAERRARGQDKKSVYACAIMLAANELVEGKVSQQEFLVGVMAKKEMLIKATPQEKNLIEDAINNISGKLTEMMDKLVLGKDIPRPAKKKHHEDRDHRDVRRKHPYPEPL